MPSATNNKSDADSVRRLTVRLTKRGEPDRVLEFHAGADRARVIGCAPNADVVLGDRGVLPVHCYFEREGGELWLSPAQSSAEVRVNYELASGRLKLGKRSILEVGEARLQILVIEESDSAPRHGKFGTEVIELGALGRAPTNLSETTPVDMSVALNEFPTTAWKRMDSGEAPAIVATPPAVVATHVSTPQHSSPAHTPLITNTVPIRVPVVAPRPLAVDSVTTTEPIPRGAFAAPPDLEPIQPVLTSPCILIEARNRLISAPPPAPVAAPLRPGTEDDTVPEARPSPRVLTALPVSRPPPAAYAPPAPDTSPRWPQPVPGPAGFGLDPGSMTTVGHPIAEFRTPEPVEPVKPVRESTPARPVPDFIGRLAVHRQSFARGLGREPKVIAAAVFLAALSLSALVSQAVRGWREIVTFSVASGSASQARSAGSRRASPTDKPGSRPIASPALTATVSATPASESAPSSAGDPLAGQAVSHLLSGRYAEASGVYEVLAARYPGEPVYSAIAKILRRRLNPACKQGHEIECGKTLP